MNKIFDNKQEFTELYREAVMSISGKSVEAASDLDRFNALAKLVAEKARTVATKSDARVAAEGKKRVYYFSIEFLIGRLLDNYLLNFGVRDMVAEALDDMGFDLSVIENQEPDPALGNGGLGRLAACFLDSMAAEGIAGYGNGMRYRYGLFKQEIVNGSQVEATDEWLTHGYPWEVRRQDKAVTIKFGGRVEGFEENGRTFYRTVDTRDILAVPYDIPVVGYAGETVNKLRVWAAEPVEEHFDLEAFNRGDYALADAERAEAEAFGKQGNDVMRKLESLPIPTIAAVGGYALGGGCELAMSCDFRICSDTAVFGQPETGLGITPGFGGTQRLARLVGPGMAKQMIYTARNIKADEAYRIGLVNAVYPLSDLYAAAEKLAGQIAGNAPIAVRASKQAINDGLQVDIDRAVVIEEKAFGSCFQSADQQEGMGAFLEKRKHEPFINK